LDREKGLRKIPLSHRNQGKTNEKEGFGGGLGAICRGEWVFRMVNCHWKNDLQKHHQIRLEIGGSEGGTIKGEEGLQLHEDCPSKGKNQGTPQEKGSIGMGPAPCNLCSALRQARGESPRTKDPRPGQLEGRIKIELRSRRSGARRR